MARNHLPMRKLKEIMRLKWECGCSHRAIAQSIGVSDSTVSDCIQRIKRANLSCPLPDELTDDQLETKLYPPNIKIDVEKKGNSESVIGLRRNQ